MCSNEISILNKQSFTLGEREISLQGSLVSAGRIGSHFGFGVGSLSQSLHENSDKLRLDHRGGVALRRLYCVQVYNTYTRLI